MYSLFLRGTSCSLLFNPNRQSGEITRDSHGTFDVLLHISKKVETQVRAGRLKMGKRDPDAFRRGTAVLYLKGNGARRNNWLIGKVEVVNIDGTYDIKGKDGEVMENVKSQNVKMTEAAMLRSLARAEKVSTPKLTAREVNTSHLWRNIFAASTTSTAVQQGTFGRSDGGEGGSDGDEGGIDEGEGGSSDAEDDDGDISAAGSNLLARQRRRALRESIRNGTSTGSWKLTRGGMPVNTAEAYDEDDEDDLSELFSLDSWVGSSSDDSSGDSDNG